MTGHPGADAPLRALRLLTHELVTSNVSRISSVTCSADLTPAPPPRMIVGWARATHLRAKLPLQALTVAMGRREGAMDGLVHHSDSEVHLDRLSPVPNGSTDAGVAPSVGSKATPMTTRSRSLVTAGEDFCGRPRGDSHGRDTCVRCRPPGRMSPPTVRSTCLTHSALSTACLVPSGGVQGRPSAWFGREHGWR